MANTASGTYRLKTLGTDRFYQELRTEILRKGIHLLIGIVPLTASINLNITIAFLMSGILVYTWSELLRHEGRPVLIIARITAAASRERDAGRVVLGPITLGLGALIALMLYPEPVAALAIYALAFGDSFSSLAGKLVGRLEIPFTGGKTVAGSLACFFSVFFITLRITGNSRVSLIIGASSMLLEVIPSGDLDNIIIPVGTGFIASQLL